MNAIDNEYLNLCNSQGNIFKIIGYLTDHDIGEETIWKSISIFESYRGNEITALLHVILETQEISKYSEGDEAVIAKLINIGESYGIKKSSLLNSWNQNFRENQEDIIEKLGEYDFEITDSGELVFYVKIRELRDLDLKGNQTIFITPVPTEIPEGIKRKEFYNIKGILPLSDLISCYICGYDAKNIYRAIIRLRLNNFKRISIGSIWRKI